MAEELQRVGLVFKADGSVDFQKSLKEVNASIQENRSAFKLAQAQWDKNTKSADKLKDKQRYLKEQTKDYADKVKMLEHQLKELESSENRNETAIERKKAAVNTAKTSLAHYESELKEVNETLKKGTADIEEYANKMKNAGDKVGEVGRNLMPMSTAIAGVGVASGKMALDFEDSMAKIDTLLDNPKHLESYKDTVMDVSGDMALSLETTADGMYQTISSLGDHGKQTEKTFKIMAKSAKAGGAEVADSVSLISAGMKGYGEVNDETAQKISDLAFQTAKLGVTTFPEMARSMQPLFPLSSSLNLSYEDLFGTMATLTGTTGDTASVSTQLKAVFSGLMKPTESMAQLIHNYGYESASAMIEAEGFSGMLDILKEATGGSETEMAKLFGSTEALQAILALTGEQSDTFKDKLYAMSEAGGATEEALDKTHTKGEELRQKMQELENKFTEFGGVVADNFVPIIEDLVEKITGLMDAFKGLSEQQQTWAVKIAGIAAAIGPVLIFVGAVLKAVGTIGGAIGTLLGFLGSVAGAVVIVIGAIAGVGYAIYHDWENIVASCKQFVSDFKDMIEQDKEKIIGVWEKLKTGVTNLKDKFVAVWNAIKEKVGNAVDNIKEKMDTGIQSAKDVVSSKLDAIKEKFSSIWETCKTTVKNAIDKIKGFFDFEWSLPSLKLPHPKISGEFSLNPPKVPSFSIDWYKKAMGKAFLMQSPTAFGVNGNTVMAGGEAGAEMIVGERHLKNMILGASQNDNADVVEAIQNMENHMMAMFTQFFPEFVLGNVTIGERQLKRVLTEMGVKFA